MFKIPGKSYNGKLPPLSQSDIVLQNRLRNDVKILAQDIGERNIVFHKNFLRSADFIETRFKELNLEPKRQFYDVSGLKCSNIEAEIIGNNHANEILIVGAHYDSALNSPGANDNGSGVAALLALSKAFSERRPAKTIRFVAFANEEAPFFQTPQMGSAIYARRCKERRENIVGMINLETIGYYSNGEGSQQYPFPIGFMYPTIGNFIGFVGNLSSRRFLKKTIGSFRKHALFPSEGGTFPSLIRGIAWSDQWAFWQEGYPAIMITDTAPFRYPYYHTSQDTPDKIHYDHLTRVVAGLEKVITEMVN